jgi:hypothetical protein
VFANKKGTWLSIRNVPHPSQEEQEQQQQEEEEKKGESDSGGGAEGLRRRKKKSIEEGEEESDDDEDDRLLSPSSPLKADHKKKLDFASLSISSSPSAVKPHNLSAKQLQIITGTPFPPRTTFVKVMQAAVEYYLRDVEDDVNCLLAVARIINAARGGSGGREEDKDEVEE